MINVIDFWFQKRFKTLFFETLRTPTLNSCACDFNRKKIISDFLTNCFTQLKDKFKRFIQRGLRFAEIFFQSFDYSFKKIQTGGSSIFSRKGERAEILKILSNFC